MLLHEECGKIVDQLLWDMLEQMSEETKQQFSDRVAEAASIVYHPFCSDRAIVLTSGSNGALQTPGTLGEVVLPLEGAKITDGI